jgi:predicted dehydrogenase
LFISKPLKVGLVGTGAMANAHLPAYLRFPEKVQLASLCDINEKSLNIFAKRARVRSIYTNFERMLKEEDIDAVDICTIHDQHKLQTIMAAEAGKHILLEKPMACTLEDCYEMVRATEKAGVTFTVAQTLRYLPSSQAVLKLIRNDEIGIINATRCDSILKQSLILPQDHWMFDGSRAGGGVLITLSIHLIDLMRYFLGDVKKVSGICTTFQQLFINGAEDFVSATLEFKSGAIGNIFASLSTSRTPWNIKYVIFGDSGTIYSDPPKAEKSSYQIGNVVMSSRNQDKESEKSQKGHFIEIKPDYNGLVSDNPFINEVVHFSDCCLSIKKSISSGRDNINTMKVIFGTYKSSDLNKSIDLNNL